MSVDVTTLAVAVLGVAGTLSSPLLGQWIASHSKKQEFELQRQQREEEREAAQRQSMLDERRKTYAALNAASRQYQQELTAYLRAFSESTLTSELGAELGKARDSFRDLYTDAQMTLPDKVFDAAIQVSSSLGKAYGMVNRLVAEKPRIITESGTTETVKIASEYLYVSVYNDIIRLREVMRNDLGVSDRVASGEQAGEEAGREGP